MITPKRPSGGDEEAQWCQWVHDSLIAMRVCDTPGTLTSRTSRGTSQITKPGQGGGASAPELYRIKSVQGDYITCRPWDGVNEIAADTYVAKEYRLRESLPGITALGTTFAYSISAGPDANNRYRTASAGPINDLELVAPPWVVDEHVWVLDVGDTTVRGPGNVPVTKILLNRTAAWAKVN